MLRVRLLGGLELEGPTGPLPLPARRPGRSLLGYLALHPGLHARGDLAALLWPDVLAQSARSSLRSALVSVRAALGEEASRYLVATRDRVGLAGPDRVEVDAVAWTHLVADGGFEQALTLCRGELLQGLDDDWILEAREEHRAERDALLGRLAEGAEEAGDASRALGYAHRRLALDPRSEPGVRDLMRRLTAAGERAAALTAYDRLRDRLTRELRTAPSEETRALAQCMRTGERPAPGPGRGPLPALLVPRRPVPFVGRELPRARLGTTISGPPGPGARIAMVTGDAGIGKTRLLAEVAQDAHNSGMTVLAGRCRAQTGIPYQPVVEALRHHLRHIPGALPDTPGAGELGLLVPELGGGQAPVPHPVTGDPEGESPRLFRAMLAALLALGRTEAVVLVLDDLHEADPLTLRLLEHAVASDDEGRLAFLVALRDTEAGPALRGFLTRARRAPGAVLLPLQGLDDAAVGQLVEHQGAPAPARARAVALRARTGGNPLHLGALLDRGPDGPTDRAPALPEEVSDVIDEELAALSPSTRAAVAVAAVVGDPFGVGLVADVLDAGESAVIDSLDEAAAARIVHDGEAVGTYEFRHPLMRECADARLTPTRRAHLHRRVAEALERSGEAPARRIAEHLLRAGRLAPALESAERIARAARDAELRHFHEDAAELYAGGAALLDGTRGNTGRTRRGALLVALGHARLRAGQAGAAREPFVEAAGLARARGDGPGLADAALGICAVPFFGGNERVDAVAVGALHEALALLGDEDDARRAQLLARLARELCLAPGRPESEGLAGRALDLARRSGDPAAIGAALDASHVLLLGAGDTEVRLALAAEMLELGWAHGDVALQVQGHIRRGVDLLELGDIRGMATERQALRRLAAAAHQPAYGWWAALWDGTEAILRGRYAEAARSIRSAREVGRPGYGEGAEVEFGVQTFWLHREQGELGTLVEDARAEGGRAALSLAWSCAQAAVRARAGDLDGARGLLVPLTGPQLPALRAEPAWPVTANLLAEACSACGEAVAAGRVLAALAPAAGRWAVSPNGSLCICPVTRSLALLAATTGDRREADRYFVDALARARALEAPPLVARLEREREALLSRRSG